MKDATEPVPFQSMMSKDASSSHIMHEIMSDIGAYSEQ